MAENNDGRTLDLTEHAADIVAAYVSNNPVSVGDLPSLIAAVHTALVHLAEPPAPEPQALSPAVPLKKSITPDYLISLEDGRKFRSLKRHLGTLGMTPEEYRTKWGLPPDYPMVSPNYSAARSQMARSIGLGRKTGDRPAPRKRAKKSDA